MLILWQIIELFAPRQESIDSVSEWLESSGIEKSRFKLSGGRNWINFEASVAEVENLLQTEYKLYEHPAGGHHIGCDEYSLPQHLTQHVDFVMPTVQFDVKVTPNGGDLKKREIKPGDPGDPWLPKKGKTIKGPGASPEAAVPFDLSTCNQQITPDCLRALYNFPNGTLAKSSYGIVEYTPQAYLQSDLNLFYTNLARQIPSGTAPTLDSIDGGVDQTTTQGFNYNGESDLDLEYAIALGMLVDALYDGL